MKFGAAAQATSCFARKIAFNDRVYPGIMYCFADRQAAPRNSFAHCPDLFGHSQTCNVLGRHYNFDTIHPELRKGKRSQTACDRCCDPSARGTASNPITKIATLISSVDPV